MNIFEILASDNSSGNSFFVTMSQSQRKWNSFKKITQQFLTTLSQSALNRARSLWEDINKTAPQIIFMVTQYFMSQLNYYIKSVLKPKIVSRNFTLQKINQIALFIGPNLKFVQIFKNDLLYSQVIEMSKQLVIQYGLHQSFINTFKNAYKLHCKDILDKQLIDLVEQMKQYIETNSQDVELVLNKQIVKQFIKKIHQIGVMKWYMQPAIQFLNKDLENFIIHYVDPSQNKQFHKQCLNYGRTFQKSFLRSINSEGIDSYINQHINEIDNNVYFLCTKNCSNFILDIILDFPESLPTILSLKQCIDKCNLLSQLSEKLVRGVEKRLLIPGVLTQNVLNQYINMLKVLQILDPHGFIFDRVTLPIKNYLLKRNDTLRCIISFLTEDVQNYSKLTKQVVKIPSKEYIEEADSDEDENAAQRWQILAVKQNKTKVRIKYQQNDLVTMLVNLYGSQQAFINQYQNMLAQKLMSAKDYNIEEEIRNIELLKLRFGQMALQTCNIIVKDVKDSKKNDKEIHMFKSKISHGPISLSQVNCLAVSKGYWPINYEASSNYIPQAFKQVFDEYSEYYSKKKAMRKIFFHYNLGHVNLTLSFKNGDFDFKCMPVHAVLINNLDQSKIKNKGQGVSSQQLSNELNLPQQLIKQKMSFWVHKGVVKQTRIAKGLSLRRMNSFEDGQTVYYKPVQEYYHVASDEIDDDIDNLIIKESTSMQSHLKHIIQGLIISILNINGPKSPQKIHLLLKTIYKTDLDYTYGQAQTIEILKKMVQKKKIEFNGETYSTKPEA